MFTPSPPPLAINPAQPSSSASAHPCLGALAPHTPVWKVLSLALPHHPVQTAASSIRHRWSTQHTSSVPWAFHSRHDSQQLVLHLPPDRELCKGFLSSVSLESKTELGSSELPVCRQSSMDKGLHPDKLLPIETREDTLSMPGLISVLSHPHNTLSVFPLTTTWLIRIATVQHQEKIETQKTQARCLPRAHPFHTQCRGSHMIKGRLHC